MADKMWAVYRDGALEKPILWYTSAAALDNREFSDMDGYTCRQVVVLPVAEYEAMEDSIREKVRAELRANSQHDADTLFVRTYN
jgi:hypothetical protein